MTYCHCWLGLPELEACLISALSPTCCASMSRYTGRLMVPLTAAAVHVCSAVFFHTANTTAAPFQLAPPEALAS